MRTEPHETRDITFGGFAKLACAYAGLVALGALAALVTQKILLRRWDRRQAGIPAAVDVLPPEPRLESDNSAELGKLRAREDALLSRYAWVDRKRSIARIPLERALDVALQRGFPSAGKKR